MSNLSKKDYVRRGNRKKNMSLKAIEALDVNNLKISSTSEESSEFSDSEINSIRDSVSGSNATTSGRNIFTFQNKKKLNRVSIATPVKNKNDDFIKTAKTPIDIRKRMKKGITNILHNDSSDDNPFSASDSEYTASNEDGSSSDTSDSLENETSESEEKKNPKCSIKSTRNSNIQSKQLQMAKKSQQKYVIKSDEYFSNHTQKKVQTSNHTLDKLNTPRLSQDQLQVLLKNMTISKEHEICIKQIAANSNDFFCKWLYLLHEDFNILLYGLGSKRNIFQEFQRRFLTNLPVIVINGFFPSLTLKDILDAIVVDILELRESTSNVYETCDLICREFEAMPNTHLYLIVHNIEGDMLRNSKTQTALSKLAAIKNIHLIASIDHINAPLIWDHNKLSKFKFTWWDVTSFLPYINETSFESSMMVQKTGNLALSSLKNVFLSLTTNSKGIYLIMVRYQLDNQTNQYYQGILFKDLYWSCREAFLVSSDLALRAQLTEFVDHKMIKFKRSLDGAEYLIIPIQNSLLQQFLHEQTK